LTPADDVEAPPSSAPAPAPDATPEPSPGTDATSPSSSETDTAPSVVDPVKSDEENLLSVVQDAWKPAEEDEPVEKVEPSPTSTEPASTVKIEGEQADKELADPTPEELAKFTPSTKARVEGLIRQRKSLEAQLAEVQPAAESFAKLNTYVTANRLNSQEVSDGLALMASLKRGDFKTFYEGVMPLVKVAAEAIGESLPDDLYSKVEEGTISEDEAKELTRLRHENSYLKGETQEVKTAREAEAVRSQAESVRGAINQWEAGIRARDPDFTEKQSFIKDVSESFLFRFGIPRTPEDGVKMAKEVYARVNDLYAKANKTAPRPIRAQPNGGGSSSTGVAAAPNSLQEAVSQAITRARSGL
jgi:hypothetical protein